MTTSVAEVHAPTEVARMSLYRSSVIGLLISVVATAVSIYIPSAFGADVMAGQTHFAFWVQIIAVFASYMSTWLCVTQHRFNYVWAMLSVLLLVYVFANQHLYASMLQNVYLVPTVVIGWFMWRRDSDARPVTWGTWRYTLVALGLTALIYAATYFTLRGFNSSLLITDTIIAVGSILAQWLLDRKVLWNWIVWFIVDVIAVWEYAHQGLWLVAIQFFVFIITAVMGFVGWYKTMAKRPKGFRGVELDENGGYDSVAQFLKFHVKEI